MKIIQIEQTLQNHRQMLDMQVQLHLTTATKHPFNSSLHGTTQESWYQKNKTNLDLLKQVTVSGSVIS